MGGKKDQGSGVEHLSVGSDVRMQKKEERCGMVEKPQFRKTNINPKA